MLGGDRETGLYMKKNHFGSTKTNLSTVQTLLINMMHSFAIKTLILATRNAFLLRYGSYLVEVVVQDYRILGVFKGMQKVFCLPQQVKLRLAFGARKILMCILQASTVYNSLGYQM